VRPAGILSAESLEDTNSVDGSDSALCDDSSPRKNPRREASGLPPSRQAPEEQGEGALGEANGTRGVPAAEGVTQEVSGSGGGSPL
jgi:hypothetical protein